MTSFLNSSYDALASGASYVASGVSSGFSYATSGLSYVKDLVSKEEPKSVQASPQETLQSTQAAPHLQLESINKKKAAAYNPEEYLAEPPQLLTPTNFNEGTHSSLIIAEMLARAQKQTMQAEDLATLKFETTQQRLQRDQRVLNEQKRQITDVNMQVETWDSRERFTNYLLSGTTVVIGGGLLYTGNPAGGYMMLSGAGSFASQMMQDFHFNSTAVTLTSLASGLIALGGGLHYLYSNINVPAAVVNAAPPIEAVGNQLTGAISLAATIFTTFAGVFRSYTTYKRHENLSEVMKLEALSNVTETKVKTLFDKFPGIASAFQNAAKSTSGMMKGLVRAHKRSCDATKMVLNAFGG